MACRIANPLVCKLLLNCVTRHITTAIHPSKFSAQHSARFLSGSVVHMKEVDTPSTHRENKFSTTAADVELIPNDETANVVTRVNEQLYRGEAGRLFAVVYIHGKQRKVTGDDLLLIRKQIEADIGERIVLNKVLLVGGKDFSLAGRPMLDSDTVRVEATVIEKTLSYTDLTYQYKRRKTWHRPVLKKYHWSILRINSITMYPLKEMR